MSVPRGHCLILFNVINYLSNLLNNHRVFVQQVANIIAVSKKLSNGFMLMHSTVCIHAPEQGQFEGVT